MKNAIYFLFISAIILSIVFGCQKSKQIDNPESIVLKDTIFIHDSIIVSDTIFLIDSIIFSDTIVLYDTIYVQDTSEFDYLFKHYELDVYEVLFYTLEKQKSGYQICKMLSNSHSIDIQMSGLLSYPVWAQESKKFYFANLSNGDISMRKYIDEQTYTDSVVLSSQKQKQFLWYHEFLKVFLYQSNNSLGNSSIFLLDPITGEEKLLSDENYDVRNAVSSKVDDWIYYSKKVNEIRSIYRIKSNGCCEELVFSLDNYNLHTFNVSADGKFLITPKYKDGKGFIVFYDIERHQVIRDVELPVEGYPLYASISDDNKAVFFVNGVADSYTSPRNIFRMALDRTQLFQLTNYENYLAGRPLVRLH